MVDCELESLPPGCLASGRLRAYDPPAMVHHHPIPRDVLGCIVTGYAKGGTTLLKDLVVQTTGMVGRFEGGLLLAEAPRDGIPEPHATHLVAAWRTAAGFLDRYRECASFEDGYRLLRESAAALPRHDAPLVDKTPEYLVRLDDVLRRAPGTPIVVVIRDPVHVAVSWMQLGNPLDDTVAWLRAATESFVAAIESADQAPRLFVVNFGDLLRDVDAPMARLHEWLGLPHVPMPAGMKYGLPYVQAGRVRLPRGIEVDRHDIASRCSPVELERVRGEVARAIPLAARVAGLPSGPAAGCRLTRRRAA